MNLIAAVSLNGVIGQGNSLPWHIPEDMAYFKNMTMGCAVIMGRRTYESIGKPLPWRLNIVLSRNEGYKPIGVAVVRDVSEAMHLSRSIPTYVIGGELVYAQLLPLCSHAYITEVQEEFEGDRYFHPLDKKDWEEVHRVKRSGYHFVEYRRRSDI